MFILRNDSGARLHQSRWGQGCRIASTRGFENIYFRRVSLKDGHLLGDLAFTSLGQFCHSFRFPGFFGCL